MSNCTEPHLGLATTRQMLDELIARGEVDGREAAIEMQDTAMDLLDDLPDELLDYRTAAE